MHREENKSYFSFFKRNKSSYKKVNIKKRSERKERDKMRKYKQRDLNSVKVLLTADY